MIVQMFPNPQSQSNAVGVFTTLGGLGNIFGLIIGALFVSFATWPWIFYFIAILAFTESILVYLLCRNVRRVKGATIGHLETLRRLDIFGITCFTASIILFIFAVTFGSAKGWASAGTIVSLILSIVMMVAFLLYEAHIPIAIAVIPPQTWAYPNLGIILAIALLPYLWWGTVQSIFSWYWQEVVHWSAITTALHFLPLGLSAIPATAITTRMHQHLRLKHVFTVGNGLAVVGSLLLPFGDTRSKYWSLVFPGFVIGSAGVTITFVTANVAVFMATPPEAVGVAAAVFNAALQLGCAAGIAVTTSIQTTIQVDNGDPFSYTGRADAFWFLFALTSTIAILVLVFMQDTLPATGGKRTIENTQDTPMTPVVQQ